MQPKIIIFEPEKSTGQVLKRLMAQLGVNCEIVETSSAMMQAVSKRHFDGILIDCDHIPAEGNLVASLRRAPATHSTVIFAMAADKHLRHEAYKEGATFLLEKPLVHDSALRCFHAAYGMMYFQLRHYERHVLEVPVKLTAYGMPDAQAMLVNLSAGGMCLQTSTPIAAGTQGHFEFALPGSEQMVQGSCQVCWSRDGNYGFRFLQLMIDSVVSLNEWLEHDTHRSFTPLTPPEAPQNGMSTSL